MKRILLFSLLIAFLGSVHVNAQSADSPRGITLSPAVVEVGIKAGASQTVTINLRNNETTPSALNIAFSSLIPTDPTIQFAKLDRFDAAGWLSYQSDSLILDSGQTGSYQITIEVPEDASPGGHYAFVRNQVLSTAPNVNSVEAIPEITVPLLITVPGEVNESLRLDDISTPRFVTTSIFDATTALTNDGNVHNLPQLTGTLGRTTNRLDTTLSLPGTQRQISQTFKTPGNSWWRWGAREVGFAANYGTPQQQTMSPTRTVWLLPNWPYLVIYTGLLITSIYVMFNRRGFVRAWSVLLQGAPSDASIKDTTLNK